jgi:hypothetical protein
VESLESRLALSAVTPVPPAPVYIAPTQTGLAAIELPPVNTLPPGATQLSSTPTLPAIAGAAEALAVNAAIAFQTAHPNATQTVTDPSGTHSFAVTVTEQDGAYYFTYMVSETTKQINVGYVEHDTTLNTVVQAGENPVQQTGGLAFAQFNQSTLISLEIVTEVKGVETTYQYPSSNATLPPYTTRVVKVMNAVIDHLTPAQIDHLFTEIGNQLNGVLDHLTPATVDHFFAEVLLVEIGSYL